MSAVLLQRFDAVAQPIVLRAHCTKFVDKGALIAVDPIEDRSYNRHVVAQAAHIALQRKQRASQPLQIDGLW